MSGVHLVAMISAAAATAHLSSWTLFIVRFIGPECTRPGWSAAIETEVSAERASSHSQTCAGGRAPLRDRPHDERLTAARVAGDEHAVAACSSSAGSGPVNPIARSTRSAGRDSSVPGTSSNGGLPVFALPVDPLDAAVAGEVRGRDREVALAALLQGVGRAELQRPGGPRRQVVADASAGGSPTSSICVTDAAPSRCACATQSAPVSPPPTTSTCLPAAVISPPPEPAIARPRS